MNKAEVNKLKAEVAEAGRRMLGKGLVAGASGNISIRVPGEERMVITPSQVGYDLIGAGDIVMLDFERNVLEGERSPSIEAGMHIGVYKARRDVGAVVHTHSVYASAVASVRRAIPPFLDEMVLVLGGEIEVAEYGMPGSEELARNAVRALGKKNAVLLANHGPLCCGKDLESALGNAELVERVARIFILSSLLGSPRNLPPEAVELERNIFEMRESGG
jgi:L-fuculose-phosphate aldolase